MTEAFGRPIGYVDMPEEQFRSLLVEEACVPEEVVDVEVRLHFAAWKRGDADIVTDTCRELTGRAPTTLAEWLACNRGAFETSEPAPHARVAARA